MSTVVKRSRKNVKGSEGEAALGEKRFQEGRGIPSFPVWGLLTSENFIYPGIHFRKVQEGLEMNCGRARAGEPAFINSLRTDSGGKTECGGARSGGWSN